MIALILAYGLCTGLWVPLEKAALNLREILVADFGLDGPGFDASDLLVSEILVEERVACVMFSRLVPLVARRPFSSLSLRATSLACFALPVASSASLYLRDFSTRSIAACSSFFFRRSDPRRVLNSTVFEEEVRPCAISGLLTLRRELFRDG